MPTLDWIRKRAVLNHHREIPFHLLQEESALSNLEIFEETHFLESEWRLSDCDSALTEAEFPMRVRAGQAGEVDVNRQGRIEFSFLNEVSNQLTLLEGEPGWSEASLAVWIDAHIPHTDLTQSDVRLFVHKSIVALLARTNASLPQIAREKFRLREALERKIVGYRSARRRVEFQRVLFGKDAGVEVRPELVLQIGDASRYSPNWLYEGSYSFRKHIYPQIGELKSSGEEYDCAIHIDEHEMVKRWARNISNRPLTSFWLQTSTDRFYPDFIGELIDGRVFAVESKGGHLWSNDDSIEKRAVGDLWAAASKGLCVFAMPEGTNWSTIDSVFGSGKLSVGNL